MRFLLVHALVFAVLITSLAFGTKATKNLKSNVPVTEATLNTDNSSSLTYIKGKELLLEGKYEEAAPLLEKSLTGDPNNTFILNQLAEVFLRIGDFEKAEVYSKRSLDQDPNSIEALATYGGVLNSLKRYEEAKTIFRKIVELDPTNSKATLLLGVIEAESGDIDGGIKTLTKAIEANGEDMMAYFYRAKLYVEASQLKDAVVDLQKCISIRPSFVEAGASLGILYERIGDTNSAIETYEKIQGIGSYKKRLAQLYLEKNLLDKAHRELSDYVQYEPDDYTARVKMGLLSYELKRYPQAMDQFKKILTEQPKADNVRFYLGAVLEDIKDYSKALIEFKKISRHSSFFKEATLHVGYILRETQKFNEGLSFAKKTLKENPDIIDFYDMQASFYESLKDNKKAMDSIQSGLNKFPKDERLLYFEAALYDKMNQRQIALGRMRHILEINPQNPHALNFIGYTYAEMNQNLEEAKLLVQKALTIRPNDGFITDSLGWICFKLGQIEEADQYLNKARSLQPNEPIILEHLGDLALHRKQFEQATELYRQAMGEYNSKKEKEPSKKMASKIAMIEKERRAPTNTPVQ